MEDFLDIVAFEKRRLLLIAQEQGENWCRHLEDSFQRLSTAQPPPLLSVLDEFQMLAGDSLSQPPEQLAASEHSPGEELPDCQRLEVEPEGTVPRADQPEKREVNDETSRILLTFSEENPPLSWWKLAVDNVDYLAGLLVFLNSVVMMAELELAGRAIGRQLGLESDQGPALQDIDESFKSFHNAFVFIFLGELILRIGLRGKGFFMDVVNWFDALLVAVGLFEFFIGGNTKNVLMLRTMRTLKAFRAIRMIRSIRLLKGLKLLVKACTCFLPSLAWSMLLLVIFMSIGTLVLGNLLQDFLIDDSQILEDRHWIWNRYGTAYRAMYTLYEITFAGNWPTNARPVMEKVDQGFVVFYLLYVTLIVFAVIRVISAIFLKDTLDAAQQDAESVVLERLRMKKKYMRNLEALFRAMDKEGYGTVSEKKLTALFANPKVEAYFDTLDVDVTEGALLVNMMDNGDGEVTLAEFVDGILRCRGNARALDQVALRVDLKHVDAKLNLLLQSVGLDLNGSKSPAKTSSLKVQAVEI